ncbi:restriction endonuclease subunit S [Pseudoalteromonas carrageenovora]|uniref:restriction endonuclease subunit S n=1 Tax=Pseudoalteromonas carrageenovora TaxID=227 RepID=UPI002117F944|nr:restriction endonuclease subunit S [Pseudoalteromonas carrageenovora]MCQ8888986.1 restriction endonuclease subunit S [Pseudoalteromonas carrageenovora]
MTGRYKAYPEYKDSGVDWFGNIPSHWRISGFKKHISSIVDYRGKTPIKTDEGVLLVTARNVKNGKLDYSLSQEYIAPDDYDDVMSRGKPKIGHVLFTTEAPLGEVANIDRVDFALAQRIIKFNGLCNHLNNYYFKYLIMSEEFQQSLNLFASGSTVKGIKAERFVYLRNLLPSYEEQQKIASFLDHETAKIDTLIAKQEKLIELLKEKRQAVISHAVTKGLNPDAPMCDSGVEWLGEVPEHWELKKFKYLFKIRKRIAGKTGLDILSITKKGIKVKDISSGEGQLSMDYSKYQLVNAGDFAMNHMDLLTGFVDISKYNGVTSPDYRVFTLEHKYSESDYYLRVLQMGYLDKIFYPLGQGAANIGRWRLPTEAFNEFLAPCPPYKEQEQISSFINKTHDKIDALLEKAESAINLMKERKIGLISAAVTGKIDVRDWEA